MSDDHLYDLVIEWDERRQNGEEVAPEVLCKNEPELLADLESRISSIKATDWMLDSNDDGDDDFLSLPDFSVDLNPGPETQLPSSTLSIEQFSKAIASSGLMDADEVESVQHSATSHDAESLARELINRNKLTEYQAKLLYQGKEDRLVFDNYVILDKIGEGGMGQVYLAEHRRMGRKVALKTLPPTMTQNVQAIRRFHREVQAAAKLSHPNVVAAFDAAESNGVHYLVMEHVEGVDLRSLVKKNGPLSVELTIDYVQQAAQGLAYAHSEGITHRDIKPSNVLLSNKGIIKVLDMGLARMDEGSDGRTQTELTQSGAVMGTVDYMSPEQALDSKHADARSDIYSLGCMLHFLLTGKPVYGGDTVMKKLLAHRDQQIPSIKEIRSETPRGMDNLFRKMVAKRPEDRYQTMNEVIEALRICDVDDPEPAAPESKTAVDDENYQKFLQVIEVEDTPTIVESGISRERPSLKERVSFRIRNRKSFPMCDKKGLLIGTAATLLIGFLGYLFYAQVIKVETPEGTIVIEASQQDVEIFIDNKQVVTIIDPNDKTKIKVEVEPGKHTLKVMKGGFEAYVKNFSLKGLDGKPIKVSLMPKKQSQQYAGEPVDLLALVDPERDAVQGKWSFDAQNRLMNEPGQLDRIQVPFAPGDEYDLTLLAEQVNQSGDALCIGLVGGGRQFQLVLNYFNSDKINNALQNVDGKGASSNITTNHDNLFSGDEPLKIVCRVRRSSVTVECDGKRIIDWRRSFDRLTMPGNWAVPKKDIFSLGVNHGQFRIHKMTLTPLSTYSPQNEREIAEWLLRNGVKGVFVEINSNKNMVHPAVVGGCL